jgi:alkaline phosphatase D
MSCQDDVRSGLGFEGSWNRRLLLAYCSSLAGIPLLARASWAWNRVSFSSNPFALGVASGDVDSTSVVLWTRLAPMPLEPHGGMTLEPVAVRWELAEDEAMRKVAASGTSTATPQLGHAVHVEVSGLQPDRWYWYRFHAGDATSPVGRTRTLPAADAPVDRLRFAFVSCQHYETGLYNAYQHMADQDIDLVVHLGDYIYEGAGRDGRVRKHVGNETQSLTDYRVRLSQYRADPLLHTMHARCPWFVTWDDHEFDNNYAADVSEEPDVDPIDFLVRRANAYQAYYEMMPLRATSLPTGPHMRLYRRAAFGQLASLLLLDTRQYRSDQPNDDRKSALNDAALHPRNTMLGDAQRHWLEGELLQSQTTWNILAQQVMMGMVGFAAEGDPLQYSMDQWSGYAAERMRLMWYLADRRVPNPIVLTGDIHKNWVNDLRVDDRKINSPVVATEFVGTSLSTDGNGVDRPAGHDLILSHNPFVRFFNGERGYVLCTVTPQLWRSDYLVVDDVTRPGGNVAVRAAWGVEAGRPGAHAISSRTG